MVLGVCQLRFQLHGVFSLKEKRSIVKRIIGRTRSRFAVSIAEVGENDSLSGAEIGFCVVGNDRAFVNSSVDTILNHIEGLCLAELVDQTIEILNLKY